MNENLKQPKYYNRFKNYLKEKDINTNKIIHAIREIELPNTVGGVESINGKDGIVNIIGGTNVTVDNTGPNIVINSNSGTTVGYGLPLPLYTPNPDTGTFLTVDEEGKISSIGEVNEDNILLNIGENDFDIVWALNKNSEVNIPKGAAIAIYSNRTEASHLVGDLYEFTGNAHHTSGLFVYTSYKDVDNETELTSSTFVNLPDFITFNLISDNEELESGFANGNLISGSYTETFHFPRFYSIDSVNDKEYSFGLFDDKVIFLEKDDPIFKLPNTSPGHKGKTFTSGTTIHDLEWKFIDENRVKTDSSGTLSIIPDYNEGNVLELTNINTGPLELELPINMPDGADMYIRVKPSTLTSFVPNAGYIFDVGPPTDLEDTKFTEMKIRKFQGNFYVSLLVWG